CARELVRLGLNRVTEVGKMHVAKAGAPHDGSFQLGRLLRWVTIESAEERFDTGERLDPKGKAATRARQPFGSALARRMSDLVEYARVTSPFYRERLRGLALDRPSDLPRLPLLSGEDVRLNTPPAGSTLLTGPLEGAYVFASGGSTGAPKFSFYS